MSGVGDQRGIAALGHLRQRGKFLQLASERGHPLDLLGAVAKLCIPPVGTDDHSRASRMIALLIDGLRYGA